MPNRPGLTRDGVLRVAVDLIDTESPDALTMRRLAAELGVEAMSLYHHVSSKDAVLAGVVDVVVGEVLIAVDGLNLPTPTRTWQADLRQVILTARQVMLRHPWAPRLIESRASLSLPVIQHHETVLRLMREGGFSWDLAHHSLHAIGSRALGFSQELFTPPGSGVEMPDLQPDAFPVLAGMLAAVSHDPNDPSLGWCDDQTEFEFALDILLDGLERLRSREAAS